ncbi:MAG: alpha/beta hydrolase [Deltaproteobacteria bacterium]|nr:alpha/beta hydrolase [Deltaproteobacteria bacterium]
MDRRFIFFPDPVLVATPDAYGLPFEDLTVTTSDGVAVHGWFIPAPEARVGASAPPYTFVMLHGNAGNISHRIDWAKLYRDRLGVNVFLLDYRGYGRSEGEPSEQGTYLDAEAAVKALTERGDVDPGRIILAGHSLGAAVAIELALRVAPAGLVLESAFTSVSDMAKQVIPFLPLGIFLSTRYENLEKIPRIDCPLLVMHGEHDEIIPFEQGLRLYEAAPEPKTFFRIRHAGHNDTYVSGGEAYIQAYVRFLASLDKGDAATTPPADGSVPVGAR